MPSTMPNASAQLAAMVYAADQGPEMDGLLEALAHELAAQGLKLAGAVQHTVEQPASPRCGMVLEDLGTGGIHAISADTAIVVQGCRMEPAKIETLAMLAGQAIERGSDLFLLNRFGKNESAGRGYRDVISEAVSRGVPVLVGVSAANLPKWDAFAGMTYARLDVDIEAARAWCGRAVAVRRQQKERAHVLG